MDLSLSNFARLAWMVWGVGQAFCHAAHTEDEAIDYSRDIAPIFSSHCFQCHGPDRNSPDTELRLDQLVDVISDSEVETTIINPGRIEQSTLWLRISSTDPDDRMPPVSQRSSLTENDVLKVRRWIEQGARFSKHWAFVPPVRPKLPVVKNATWPRSPIDNFILQKLESQELRPSSVADQNTLLRRVSWDLTGLPPTIPEIQNFVKTNAPDAWIRLVDRLIDSPHYGERMAQPWLDAARYADTTGHAADKPRTMWLFRDWVINAFNSNMSFDQFTMEQLAGDMLPNATDSQLIATGFHRNSMQALGNNPRKEEFRIKGIVDRLDTTGRTWLGLTIGCAECHDHKYDPISQREYYEWFAIFNNVPHYGETFEVHGPRMNVIPATIKRKIARLKERLRDRKMLVAASPPTGNAKATERDQAEKEASVPQEDAMLLPLLEHIAELKSQTVEAQVMDELDEPRETFIHIRGNFENPGDRVAAGIPAVICHAEISKTDPMNRLTFARFLVDRQNPLTARVAVNRIWKHYFGKGLVNTLDDFGIRGEFPSHPKLLDWLAVEFMESGWNVKHIHRLIVHSATYRQSSDANSILLNLDPQNRLLARGPRKRLEAEQIRDVMLFASGNLVNRIGGPSVFPRQDPTIGQFRDDSAGKWIDSAGEGQYRRAMYTFWQRMSPYPSMVLFDAHSRERCVIDRPQTNTPLQALTVLNDPYFVALARDFAQCIQQSARSSVARIEFAFLTALSRRPAPNELVAFQLFVDRHQSDPWFHLAQVLLNLDETITKE